MADTTELIVYTLEYCPNCEILKRFLERTNIPYTERDMATAASLTELRVHGVFVNEAPVLRGPAGFLTSRDLFSGDALVEERVRDLAGVS